MGEAMVFLFDKECKITDFDKILIIKNDIISIKFKRKTLTINGEFLKLTYFSKEELVIDGVINMVKFKYEN